MKTEIEIAQERADKAERELETVRADNVTLKTEADKVPALTQRAETAETRVTELEDVIKESVEGIEGVEVTDELKPEDIVRAVATHAKGLTKRASEADEYRADAIETALQSGVRAFGDDKAKFDPDKKRVFLEKLDLQEIIDQGNDWEVRATGKFPNKRVSTDDADPAAPEGDDDDPNGEGTRSTNVDPQIPSSAYSGL